MTTRYALSLSFKRSILALSASSLLTLAGCGIGAPAGPTSTVFQSVTGHIHGGQTPIVGATVTLYATGSTGYGAGATVLGTARSDSYSNFTITLVQGATCPAGSQAYITAAGGGANYQPANTAMLEMAALGPCSSVNATTFTTINELTTVAAAYALSGFITTSSASGGLFAANVGGPATNNALTTAITSTTPAGLTHAFMNAANLVNPVTGAAQTTASANSNGSTVAGSVPVAELNTLADIMQACVDAGPVPNTACTTLFGITGGSNTLQTFVNLARNPYPNATAVASASTSGSLLSLISATPAFQPALTAPPTDWSVSIVYNSGLAPPYWLALDANDTVFLGVATPSATTPGLFGVSPYGVTVPAFASPSAFASTKVTRGIAPDALGNIWLTNNADAADRFSTSSGALEGTITSTLGSIYGAAVDVHNNVWFSHVLLAAGTTIDEAAYTAPVAPATTGTWALNYTSSTAVDTGGYGISVDANQNIWVAGYFSGGTTEIILPNTGTTAAPVYTASGTAITPTSVTVGTKPYSTVFDGSGNAWIAITGSNSTSTTGIQEITGGASSPTAQTEIFGTTAGSNTNVLGTTAVQMIAIDGAGTIFIPDNNSSSMGIHIYSTTSGNTLSPANGLKSCYLSTTTTTVCGATSGAAIYNPRQLAVDSTGSVWAGITSGGVTQIIGVAAPAYPLLSVGHPSTMP